MLWQPGAGAFTVHNCDGLTFTITGKVPTNSSGTQYSVPISTVTNQNVSIMGAFNGSFYGPSAANTGGNFNFHTTGSTYLTSGILAAAKR
jgi:hypothetical protein